MKVKKLIFRVDASTRIGIGHLMRCLALAQAWQDVGGHAVFISYVENDSFFRRIRENGFEAYTLQEPNNIEKIKTILRKENAGWVVLDGYHFSPEYQIKLRDLGFRLLVIDDYAHLEHYFADIVLNPNYGAEPLSYKVEPYTRVIRGAEYVLLRREFLQYASFKKKIPDVAKDLLITFGGTDFENNTLKILQVADSLNISLNIKVVVGANFPHYELIRKEIGKGKQNVSILRDVNNIASIMAWADIAVSSGGITVWELNFMKVPVMLCKVAENQEPAVNALEKEGFLSVGWIKNAPLSEIKEKLEQLIYDKNLRKALAEKGRQIVDGQGAKRIISQMEEFDKGFKV